MSKAALPILYLHFRKHLRKSNIAFETGYNNTVTIRPTPSEAIHFQFFSVGSKFPMPSVKIWTLPGNRSIVFSANIMAMLLLKIDQHKANLPLFATKVMTTIVKQAA